MNTVFQINFSFFQLITWFYSSVVEPEPQGAGTFGRNRYNEVSAPAPGQTKLVYQIIIHNWIGSKKQIKSIFFLKSHEKYTFSFKRCENRYPQANVGAGVGAETFCKSEPELEPKHIVLAPQHCLQVTLRVTLCIECTMYYVNIVVSPPPPKCRI